MKRFLAVVFAAAVLTAACGKSEQQKQAEEVAKQAEQAAKSAEQAAKSTEQAAQGAAKGLEAMAKSLEAMASGNKDGKPVDPVKFQDLIALLPQLDGWEQQKPTGERMTSPFATANAKANYTKGDSRIQVEIIDSAFNQLLLTPISMFLQVGYSQESTTGYEKSATVNGQPGWEKWNSELKSGEVNALVGKRFLLSIDGHGIDDTKPLQDAASRIDFNRLAALK